MKKKKKKEIKHEKVVYDLELLSQFSLTSKTSLAMCTAITSPWCVDTLNAALFSLCTFLALCQSVSQSS